MNIPKHLRQWIEESKTVIQTPESKDRSLSDTLEFFYLLGRSRSESKKTIKGIKKKIKDKPLIETEFRYEIDEKLGDVEEEIKKSIEEIFKKHGFKIEVEGYNTFSEKHYLKFKKL